MGDVNRRWKCKNCNGTGWCKLRNAEGYLNSCLECDKGITSSPDERTLELAAKWSREMDEAERKVAHFYCHEFMPVWDFTGDIPTSTIDGTGCWVTAIRGHWIFLAFGV